ncbi:MAG: hypothetical protein IJR41_01255, partial [Atopobiaceae bacterium]|nr:hypothetical protein [Atopobiaceae bacterium]
GPVSDPVMLERKLETASRAIRRALKANGIDYSDPDEEFAGDLMDVCCSVANRLMPSGGEYPQGVTQATMTAVGFSQTYSFGSAYGIPKLLPSELKILGIGGRVGYARPSYGILEPEEEGDV